MRLTPEGRAALALLAALGFVAFWTGQNPLYLVVAAGVAWFVLAWAVARFNLRGVDVARVLPAELFATTEARGRFVEQHRVDFLREQRRDRDALAFAAG